MLFIKVFVAVAALPQNQPHDVQVVDAE